MSANQFVVIVALFSIAVAVLGGQRPALTLGADECSSRACRLVRERGALGFRPSCSSRSCPATRSRGLPSDVEGPPPRYGTKHGPRGWADPGPKLELSTRDFAALRP